MIILPAIDLRNGKCVRLHQGKFDEETIYGADPLAMAEQWVAGGAKRLHLVDLDGAFSGRPVHQKLILNIATQLRIPIEVGGGIRDLETIRTYLDQGVEKVILGSVAISEPGLVRKACQLYPEQVMVGIDAKDGLIAVKGWVDIATKTALELAYELSDLGVNEIIYTDISRDGTLLGPNIPALMEIIRASGLKVIASGGVACLDDLLALKNLDLPKLSGVIIGKALYDQRIDLAAAIKVIEG